jgi:hypothetical protein
MNNVTRRESRVARVLLLLVLPGLLEAQSLPAWRSISPIMASRSALGFQPIVPAAQGWHGSFQFDYGNVLEQQTRPNADIVLDGELMRADLTISHSFGRWFVQGAVPFESAQAGNLDGFINWWHGVFGFDETTREQRPEGLYEYFISLADSNAVDRDQGGLALGDTRLSFGFHHAANWQTTLVVSLPTNGRPDGWGLQTVALGLSTTARAEVIRDRLTWEGSVGVGYTPAAGRLEEYQRTTFMNASAGLRLRVIGQQAVYTNLIFHSAAWQNTTLPALDNQDISLDFGFLLKAGNGPEIVLGMVEDPYPFGPAVDLVLRIGARW